ncbi:siphovirus Gp157 family protein [Flavobacteriaceae bacterium]|nr:siphovirus Gp157 family protein [Flavobacteriaceae bacterium]
MKLYEITGAMKDVEKMIDEGVPLDQLEDTLNEIEIDFKEKAESCLFALANINSEVNGCKIEIDRLIARKKSKEAQAAKLKEYLLFNMQELKSGKIDNGVMSASLRKGAPALKISNEDAIPLEFKKIATSVSTDKKALLAALKELTEGEVIEGAEVVPGKTTLTIK